MSSAIVKMEAAPVVRSAGWEMTPEQEKMIRDTFLSGASPQEAAVLLEVAKVRRLNPLTRQIHFVKRWDSQKRCEVWAFQVGIDGFRVIAERTGVYDGQDEPEFEHDKNGIPTMCRVRVYRKGWSRPAVGVAYYREYVQTKKADDGRQVPNSMWSRGPHFMLAKCAEAAALRKAFPEDCGDLYIPEEMPEEHEINAAPVPGASRTEQVKNLIAARAQTTTIEAPAQREAEVIAKVAEVVGFDEPPPPGDEDAPPPGDAPWVDSEATPANEPPPSEPVVTVRQKGKDVPISSLDERSLAFWAQKLERDVADPSKSRWHDDNARKLAAIRKLLGATP